MKLQLAMDKSAMGLSFLCLAHCLLLPSVAVLLPALIAVPLEDELFHRALLVGVVPLSVLALAMGCRQHKSWSVFICGVVGVIILVLAGLFGHDLVGEIGERIATVIGSLFIIVSHYRNYRMCCRHRCGC